MAKSSSMESAAPILESSSSGMCHHLRWTPQTQSVLQAQSPEHYQRRNHWRKNDPLPWTQRQFRDYLLHSFLNLLFDPRQQPLEHPPPGDLQQHHPQLHLNPGEETSNNVRKYEYNFRENTKKRRGDDLYNNHITTRSTRTMCHLPQTKT
jgi:hypothetical protein